MAGRSAENAPSLPSFEQQVEDIEEEVESDSSSEEYDSNEEKKENYSLCLGADDEYVSVATLIKLFGILSLVV